MKQLLILFVLLCLTACGGDGGEAPQARVAPPQAGWTAEEDGLVRHVRSNIGFPQAIGAYERVKVIDFAKDGSDVGVVYKATPDVEGAIQELTLYATYHEDVSAKYYLDVATKAIVDRFEGLEFVQEGEFEPEGGRPIKGAYRLFKTQTKGIDYRTGVWVTKDGNWMLKARFTYPGKGDETIAMLAKMLNAEMAKSGSSKGVHITSTTKEGVAPEMEHVAVALKAVVWP